ncbi:MAG TPA: hypothetical protein VHE36_06725 [Sphingomicrobium sp.]|nr:hypothetical protein [Sphingomicrobium sp.]
MLPNPAMKRYNSRMVRLWLVYAAFLLVAIYMFKHQLLSGPVAYGVAVLPAIPIILVFATVGRYLIEESDEYLRMLMVRQTLWASGFALSLATIWGFLESFDLVDHVDAYYIAIVWFLGLGVGAVINRLTLGSTVKC